MDDLIFSAVSCLVGIMIGWLIAIAYFDDKIRFQQKMEHHQIKCDTLSDGNLHCYEIESKN